MRIEQTILSNLLHNEEYARKVLPFVNKRYFSERKEAIIFEEYQNFFDKYNKPITKEILAIEVSNRKDLTDKEYNEFSEYISQIEAPRPIPIGSIMKQNLFVKRKLCIMPS